MVYVMTFWEKLHKPFFTLAPMADVTDPAYRKLIGETHAPDVMWTEFVSADGLYHTREKKEMKDEENPLVRDLLYSEKERPIVAQFFTARKDMMEYASRFALTHGFDGVDINMGCPDRTIEKQGAGAAHMKDPERAKEVIAGALLGTEGKIPVSVKTRIGYNTITYKEWLPHLLESGISALTIHLRTRKEMSLVDAHWELGKEIVQFCRGINPHILLIGNGDVKDLEDAKQKADATGFDGIMFGRAIFGNPWLFEGVKERTPHEKLDALLTLARYFVDLRPTKHFAILKKHVKAFVNGFDGAGDIRARLMETNDLETFEGVIREARKLI